MNGVAEAVKLQAHSRTLPKHAGAVQPVALPVHNHLSPVVSDASGLKLFWRDGRPHEAVAIADKRVQAVTKRAMDVVVAAILLAVLSPLFALIAIAIKLDSAGPVFFTQKREGLNGSLFGILKFRSMKIEQCDLSGIAQTVAGDSRVTKVGAILRRYSFDELPQIMNVLLGHMSLVGPRPHVPGMLACGMPYAELVPYYPMRLAMRPGITGWAQANGFRGETRTGDAALRRVDHDIAYIQNFSVWLDVRAICRTACREFLTGSGI